MFLLEQLDNLCRKSQRIYQNISITNKYVQQGYRIQDKNSRFYCVYISRNDYVDNEIKNTKSLTVTENMKCLGIKFNKTYIGLVQKERHIDQ